MSMFNISQSTLLPNALKFDVKYEETNIPEQPEERYGYNSRLNEYRNFIDNIKSDDWKKVRWYINEYDFLVKDPIINRAFYKYWEIINEFEIFEHYQDKNLILHCAEAPGGFIQGTNIYLQIDRIPDEVQEKPKQQFDENGWVTIQKKGKKPKRDYRIYTISLNKDLPQYKCYNLPSYNKNVINKHVCITYGKDNTGDINNWQNINHINNLATKKFFLITADGGFDEGTDFNNKEQLHYCLILSEIYTALNLQKTDGHFILKVFDVFTEPSVHLLYLLTLAYTDVHIYKPKTSRPTNSEKYIICKRFRLDQDQKKNILSKLEVLYNNMSKLKSKYIVFKLFKTIPDSFVSLIFDMNKTLLQKQCFFLERAVELCNDQQFLTNYDNILTESIEKRKDVFYQWEQFYNLNSYV